MYHGADYRQGSGLDHVSRGHHCHCHRCPVAVHCRFITLFELSHVFPIPHTPSATSRLRYDSRLVEVPTQPTVRYPAAFIPTPPAPPVRSQRLSGAGVSYRNSSQPMDERWLHGLPYHSAEDLRREDLPTQPPRSAKSKISDDSRPLYTIERAYPSKPSKFDPTYQSDQTQGANSNAAATAHQEARASIISPPAFR